MMQITMNRAQRRAAERSARRAPTARRMGREAGHVLTPQQVERLVMPIHVALELLPLGLYTEAHAHDLAAFLNVAQFAANDAARDDIHAEATSAAEVLLAMRDRVRAGRAWNVTAGERETLMRSVTVLDRWYRTQTNTRWRRALRQVYAICDRAWAEGREELDLLEVPGR